MATTTEAVRVIRVTLRNRHPKDSQRAEPSIVMRPTGCSGDAAYTLCWSVDGPCVTSPVSAFEVPSRISASTPSSASRCRGPNCRRKNKTSPNRNAAATISGGVSASRSAITPAPPLSLLRCLSWHCHSWPGVVRYRPSVRWACPPRATGRKPHAPEPRK
jgi:hypothetical protein